MNEAQLEVLRHTKAAHGVKVYYKRKGEPDKAWCGAWDVDAETAHQLGQAGLLERISRAAESGNTHSVIYKLTDAGHAALG